MQYDYLIVGAGFSGSILAERIARELDKKVLLIDKRPHIAGNAYDYFDENGVLVHKYGPHIFHTNSKKVWDYLSRFTEWHPYEHRVKVMVEDLSIPIPFNMNSVHQVFGASHAERLEKLLIRHYGYGKKVPILQLRETHNKDLKRLADFIYDNIFRGYTLKQWDLTPEQLDPSVTARVPFVISRDDRYFHDVYQAMPRHGYTAMFRNILNHPNIELCLNRDYRDVVTDVKFNKLIYTGAIDQFFDYLHGELPYRSLRFEFQSLPREYYQEVAQVNYPNHYPFTRITEFKHFISQQLPATTISREYPQPHIPGENDPYYPIPRKENEAVFQKYRKEVRKLNGSVLFLGRLADYKYYNMDQIAARALMLFEKEICGN